jgi:hypothetical protein
MTLMTRFGAVLAFAAFLASEAAAQFKSPSPPPVPTFPLKAPSQEITPPIEANSATYEAGAVVPAPRIRVPMSFGAFSSTSTNAGEPAHAVTPNRGCSECFQDGVCGPIGRVWGEFDYIFWKARGDNLPALVTTSPQGTAAAQAGVLGTPGARTLVGASAFVDDFRSGFRYNVGAWLNADQTFGLQTGGFFLADTATNSVLSSNGDPILARPFKNATNGAANSQLVALPGVVAGSINVDHHNSVDGFDVALRGRMCCGGAFRLDAIVGYRYFRIEDGLAINENIVSGPGNTVVPNGANLLVTDRFETANTFNGVQTGITGEWHFSERWFISGTGKASFGWIDSVANIVGATTIAAPGQAVTHNVGGLLALSSNVGHYGQSNGVIVPELNLNLGYQVTSNLRLRAGYNFLYVNSVARPGTIIDTTVNPALIPPATGTALPARPAPFIERTDFYLHGINAGLELRY